MSRNNVAGETEVSFDAAVAMTRGNAEGLAKAILHGCQQNPKVARLEKIQFQAAPYTKGAVRGLVPQVPPATSSRITGRCESARPNVAMTSYVPHPVPGSVPPPQAVSMTTIDLLQKAGAGSAFPDCAGSVERSRVRLLHRDCKSKDSNDEKGSLCADHVKPPFFAIM